MQIMGAWYGSLQNRLMERGKDADEIVVGMGVTQFHWSDRTAWEVIEVKDQKHVTIRELDHKLIGGAYTNDWELTSNPNNRTRNLRKRGKYWYEFGYRWTDDNGKEHEHWERISVKFGYADYYYDWEF